MTLETHNWLGVNLSLEIKFSNPHKLISSTVNERIACACVLDFWATLDFCVCLIVVYVCVFSFIFWSHMWQQKNALYMPHRIPDSEMDKGGLVGAIFWDLKKAFDFFDLISSNTLNWKSLIFRTFLSNEMGQSHWGTSSVQLLYKWFTISLHGVWSSNVCRWYHKFCPCKTQRTSSF